MAPAHFPSLPRYRLAPEISVSHSYLLGKSIIDLSAKLTDQQGTTAGTTEVAATIFCPNV